MESRRKFIKSIGFGSMSLPFLQSIANAKGTPINENKKLGIALVGLGNYALNHLLVGIDASPNWELKGIVTGTPSKIAPLKEKYKLKDENILSYENFEKIKNCKDIDVVYIVLPNGLHAEYTIKAANAGKHVICEKPMANTVAEAKAMLNACNKNNVKLAIGYRCHFEPFNMELMRLSNEKTFGEIKYISSSFGFKIGDPTQWRLNAKLAGGGPLMDVGIYIINAARYVKNQEPIWLSAHFGPKTDPNKFKEVEESVSWHMQYADGTVFNGYTTYNTNVEFFDCRAEKGWMRTSPSFGYGPLKGETSKGKIEAEVVHHQTNQMNAMGNMFSSQNSVPNHISGKEGLRDMKIIEAIFTSANNNGSIVKL